ncbi:MAG: diaminopimelate decarboxylase [Chloroflexota bacterium]
MFLLDGQQVNDRGRLEIGRCDSVDLAAEFGTPLYVFDEDAIRGMCRRYRHAFESRYPNVRIEYATKAFLCIAMAQLIHQEGLHLDVASAGELHTALSAGVPGSALVLHGNNKSHDELCRAIDSHVGRIVVDNLHELDLLDQIAPSQTRPQEVLVRVAPGVDPHTHRRIRTGQSDTKFGFNVTSGAALAAVKRVVATPSLIFVGLHCHIGSNLFETRAHRAALDALLDLAAAVRADTGLSVEELNLGGGIGIRYTPGDRPPSIDAFAEEITSALHDGLARRHLPAPLLLLEPGRSIVGEAGTTLYTVGAIKAVPIQEAPGTRTYVAIDGGMSDNPRPQLYDAVYTALIANKAAQPAEFEVRVAGKHCETDTLIDRTHIQSPAAGDILAVLSTGAYNYSMASNYNRLPRPAAVFVKDGRARLVIKRETLDDLIRQDLPLD